MSFMAFCAGESAIMLCMRVWLSAVFVFGVSLFDHGVVVSVAGSTEHRSRYSPLLKRLPLHPRDRLYISCLWLRADPREYAQRELNQQQKP